MISTLLENILAILATAQNKIKKDKERAGSEGP